MRGWGYDGEQVGSSVMHLKIPIHKKKNPMTQKIQVQESRTRCVERFFLQPSLRILAIIILPAAAPAIGERRSKTTALREEQEEEEEVG